MDKVFSAPVLFDNLICHKLTMPQIEFCNQKHYKLKRVSSFVKSTKQKERKIAKEFATNKKSA